MADNPTIDNRRNGDYQVRSTDLGPTLGMLQHMRIDIGSGTTESLVSALNPLPVSGSVTVSGVATEATLDNIRDTIIATAGSSQQVQGPVANGGAIAGKNVFPIAFQDLLGNAIVPTGINVGGIYALGSVPVDVSLHIQDFSAAGEVYSLAAATANSSATARYITVDSSGAVLLQSLPTGSNTIGNVKLTTPLQGVGWTPSYHASLTDTGTVNASARKIGGWIVGNSNSTTSAYIRIYDKATAATSADTPIIKIALAPGAAANIEFPHGIPLTNGLSVRATTGVADSNTTSPTANNVFGTFLYV